MILSQRLRPSTPLAFVYIPKTSGTYLNIKSIPDDKISVNNYRSSSLPASFHMPTSKVQSIVGKDTPLFTLVRDPYDRTCSEYYFIRKEVDKFLKIVPWDVEDPKRLRWMCIKAGQIMGSEEYAKKIFEVYNNDMTVEDYLEWTTENPTYPIFYDTKTPKDFELVGQTENIDRVVYLLKELYDVDSGTGESNKNIKKDIGKPYQTKYLRSEFERKNKIEYDLYKEGIEKFNTIFKDYEKR